VLMPFLRSRGISRIDKIFVTSDNWTYYSGLKTLIEQVEVGNIIVCNNLHRTVDELGFLLSLAKEKKISVEALQENRKGRAHLIQNLSGFMIEIFCQTTPDIPTRRFTRQAENVLPNGFVWHAEPNHTETSLSHATVIRMSYKNFSILFTSDASDEFIQSIYDKIGEVVVLQIPRNGKEKISDELLKKFLPQQLVVSTGNKNIPPSISLYQNTSPNNPKSSHQTASNHSISHRHHQSITPHHPLSSHHPTSIHQSVSPHHQTIPIFSTAAGGAIRIFSNGREYSLDYAIE